jgi:hypothetical protein
MAALRAATIAIRIQKTRPAAVSSQTGPALARARKASNAPVRAKGSAKTEWLNLTNEA